MKQSNQENKSAFDTELTSCIAWFKLAELVTRKEKEKVLGLYRLLSHSFDKAYSLQVEGDILLALEDEQATQKYKEAAFLYKKEENLFCAAAIYEHLFTIEPKNYDYLSKLIALYVLLQWPEKFEQRYRLLISFLDKDPALFDYVLDLSKRVTDFAGNKRNLQEDEELDVYFCKTEDSSAFSWVLKFIPAVLKKNNADKLLASIKEYCLEQNLDFDS